MANDRTKARPSPIIAGEPPALPTGELPSGKPQVVVINGARMVMMPEADYAVLIEAARDNIEDLADAADAIDILRRIESGEEETFPAEIVHRVTHSAETGESRIKIWREFRNMTQAQLGEAIGSNRLYVSQLETGVRNGSVDILQKIAAVLGVSVDLVMPKHDETGFSFSFDANGHNINFNTTKGALEFLDNAVSRREKDREYQVTRQAVETANLSGDLTDLRKARKLMRDFLADRYR